MDASIHRPIQDKWGDTVTAGETGFVAVPAMLIKNQKFLRLDNTELVVLINILVHWWDAGEWPHPRLSSVAQRMGCSKRTVERAVERMQIRGLVDRLPSTQKVKADGTEITVRYIDLTGLISRVEVLALPYVKNKKNKAA